MKAVNHVIVLMAAFGLSSCKYTDDAEIAKSTTAAVTEIGVEGRWDGFFHERDQAFDLYLMAHEGRTFGYSESANLMIAGTYIEDESGYGVAFSSIRLDGLGAAQASGHVEQVDDKLTGDFTTDYDGTGSFDLSTSSLSNIPTDTDSLVGTWYTNEEILEFDAGGTVTGYLSAAPTCTYAGQLTDVDGLNIFTATLTVSGCGEIDGDYSGLAMFDQAPGEGEVLVAFLENQHYAFMRTLTR